MTLIPSRLLSHRSRVAALRGGATSAMPQRGFMLLEVLVALLIFAFGVLGLVGLQAAMTKSQTDSKFRADAAFLAQRLVGSMWSDASGLDKYDTASNCASHARCNEWVAEVASQLPQGDAAVVVATLDTEPTSGRVIAAAVTVTINWTPPGEDQRRFTTTSAIAANR